MTWNQTGLWQWIVAFIVSFMLWVISMDENLFEINDTLPLSPPSVSPDLIVLSGLGRDSVNVTFTGRGIGVLRDQITRNPESVQINIAISSQNQVFPVIVSRELTGNSIVFRGDRYSSLSAVEFIPGNIEFTIDRNTVRHLPVAITSSAGIPERYYWSVSSNSTVEVEGAESIINRLDSCYTVPIDPGLDDVRAAIAKPEGVVYISPSSVSAGLVPPVEVVILLEQKIMY
ncbi:MAG: hypothetical protein K8S24_03930 [Candidatus Aegiribacteria sp.]|nr:hypothetical protein [Candidatus Aegiribacteria sp.]